MLNKCKLSNEWVSWHRLFGARTELLLGIPEEKESVTGTSGAPLCLPIPCLTQSVSMGPNSALISIQKLILPPGVWGHASLEPNLSTKLPQRTQSDAPLTVKKKKRKVKVIQSCLTLCNPMDYTAHGILQARILEWVAFPFSRRSSQPRDWTQVSRIAGRFFTSWAIREAQEYWHG